MRSDNTKENNRENKNEKTCRHPEDFPGMIEMMKKCFTGESSFDCSAFMESMKKHSCCGATAKDTKQGR